VETRLAKHFATWGPIGVLRSRNEAGHNAIVKLVSKLIGNMRMLGLWRNFGDGLMTMEILEISELKGNMHCALLFSS
jgi:hypothetical protein